MDNRISHGAHRLWCYFVYRAGIKGFCWPSVRTIQRDLECHYHSYRKWLKELIAAEYVSVEKLHLHICYHPCGVSSKVKTHGVFKSEDRPSSKVKSGVFKSEDGTNIKNRSTKNYGARRAKSPLPAPHKNRNPESEAKALADLQAFKRQVWPTDERNGQSKKTP